MNIVVKRKDETDISSKQIVELMLSAFEERLQQGLNFSCSSITVELFDEETADGIVLLAIDKDTNALVGTVTVHLCKDKQNVVYATIEALKSMSTVEEVAKKRGKKVNEIL